MTSARYFKRAVYLPALVVPLLLVLDAAFFARPLTGGLAQYILIYVLGFGLLAYPVFAFFISRVIDRTPERDLVRLAWWAPLRFIPFYGTPWVLYGLGYLLLGRPAGLGMMLMWLAYLPYVLGVAYVFSAASVFMYKAIYR